MILRFLNAQGIAGIAASLLIAGLLLYQRVETVGWHKQSDRFEKLYGDEQAAFAKTTADYRAAADAARAEDRANAARVTLQQQMINEGTEDDFETRLAAARLAADRLRGEATAGSADSGGRGAAPMPALPAAAASAAQGSGDYGLPAAAAGTEADVALTATEQAIQLDELIKWVKRQAAVDPNAAPSAVDATAP